VILIGYGSIDWIRRFFIDRADLFLKVLDANWGRAREEVEAIANLLSRYGIGRDARILEVGCGNGRILINLALLGFKNLVGIDISPRFIEDAKEKARRYGVDDRIEFVVGDARFVDEVLRGRIFDAILFVWSTVIGYYNDIEVDIDILRRCRELAHNDTYLFILRHVNRDRVALIHSLVGDAAYLTDLGNGYAVVEKPVFDAKRGVAGSCWSFYRVEDRNYIFVDELCYEMKVYSLHELIYIAEKAGWKFIDVYGDLRTLSRFRPSLSNINAVFKAR